MCSKFPESTDRPKILDIALLSMLVNSSPKMPSGVGVLASWTLSCKSDFMLLKNEAKIPSISIGSCHRPKLSSSYSLLQSFCKCSGFSLRLSALRLTAGREVKFHGFWALMTCGSVRSFKFADGQNSSLQKLLELQIELYVFVFLT